jgi:hypothetical protein
MFTLKPPLLATIMPRDPVLVPVSPLPEPRSCDAPIRGLSHAVRRQEPTNTPGHQDDHNRTLVLSQDTAGCQIEVLATARARHLQGRKAS